MLRKEKSLWPHQSRSIDMLRQSLSNGKRRPLLQVPTGGGKTVIASRITKNALAKGNRVAFCVPALSLIDQTVVSFYNEGIDEVGVIQSWHPMQDYSKPVQICSIQTLEKRKFPDCNVVIVDEAHRQFKAISRWMKECPDTVFVGLSATPWAKGLGNTYDDLIIGATMDGLIEAGFLSDFQVYAPAHPDLSGVKSTAGDYNLKQLGGVMNDKTLVADVVKTWLAKGEGRPTLCFAVDCAHAQALQAQFQSAGVGCGYIDAYTEAPDRKIIEGQLARGEIQVVCNVGCLTTGVDWDVRCIVLARPTRSEMLFVQMIGRGLRTAAGKQDCIILDHADNHARMGFVTSIMHDSLDTGEKGEAAKAERKEPLPKECGKCHFLKPPKTHICPKCGFEPTKQSDVQCEEGELVAVKAKAVTTADKQAFYSGLLTIRSERNRSSGWVAHTYRDRFGVWPRGLSDTPSIPDASVINFVKSKDIRFAKRRAK